MTADDIIAYTRRQLTARYEPESLLLLQYLQHAQQHYACIPAALVTELSKRLNISKADIHGVISFYAFLHTQPQGDYQLLLSNNITDRLQGSELIFKLLSEQFPVTTAPVDSIHKVSIKLASCTGMSDQGPAMLVNGQAVTRLDQARAKSICELIKNTIPLDQWPASFFHVDDNIRRQDLLLESEFSNGSALRRLVDHGPQTALQTIEQSGLRGRGGAGFSTAAKWRYSLQADADQRYVICNADEGEPGTFKDRVLLNTYAHAVFEGMTVCAGIINANQGFVYLRAEYRYLLPKLHDILQQRREQGLLGKNIAGNPGFDFDIDIHLGAGAYICGEESALIESLEGKAGIPRKRPPFPVTSGYRNRPSVVNNVETFMAAARIVEHGAQWFSQQGTKQSAGTKLLSISGDCDFPGIYEYPFGVTVSQILEDCGASNTLAVQISGAAGTLLPAGQFNRQIAFEDLSTAGSFMIFDNSRNLLDIIKNFSEFFVHESCGFCTPCRVGTALLDDLLGKMIKRQATTYDLAEMSTISNLMKSSSHCGLGATASNGLSDLLDKFPDFIEKQLADSQYEPSFDLDAALQESREITGRDDADSHIGMD